MTSTIKINLLQFVLIEIEDAFSQGKIGSLIGIEGGHSIGSSLAMLRWMYGSALHDFNAFMPYSLVKKKQDLKLYHVVVSTQHIDWLT